MRVALILLLLSGCGPWGAARRANTVESYADFLAGYPDHGKVPTALNRSEKLRWKRCEDRRDSASFRAYLYAHPDGENAKKATVQLDHAIWREAKTRRGMESYLLNYPEGRHISDAVVALEKLDWSEAEEANTARAYASYISHNPDSERAEEARVRRDDLLWAAVTDKDSVQAYRRYLEGNQKGNYRDKAQARIEQLIFTHATIVVRARDTWRPNGRQLSDNLVREIKKQFAKELINLGYNKNMPIHSVDHKGKQPPHPLDSHPVSAGTGLIVVDLEERKGEEIPPAFVTIIKATVSIYAAGRRDPLGSGWIEQRTSPYVPPTSQERMNWDAEVRAGDMLIRAIRQEEFLKPKAVEAKDKDRIGVHGPSGSEAAYGSHMDGGKKDGSMMNRLGH